MNKTLDFTQLYHLLVELANEVNTHFGASPAQYIEWGHDHGLITKQEAADMAYYFNVCVIINK